MNQKIDLTLQVTSPVQADELCAAWCEIVSGQKYTHAEALEHRLEAILERARMALQIIETKNIGGKFARELFVVRRHENRAVSGREAAQQFTEFGPTGGIERRRPLGRRPG